VITVEKMAAPNTSAWSSGVGQLRSIADAYLPSSGLTSSERKIFIDGVEEIGRPVIKCSDVIGRAKALVAPFTTNGVLDEDKVTEFIARTYPAPRWSGDQHTAFRDKLGAMLDAILRFECMGDPEGVSNAPPGPPRGPPSSNLSPPPFPPPSSNLSPPPLPPPSALNAIRNASALGARRGGRRTRRRVHRKSSSKSSSKSRRSSRR